jgi:carboxylesterase type B
MRYRSNLGLITLLSAIGVVWAKTITTTNGTINGGVCEGYDVNYFLAIPYAEPPVGELRFAAPEPYNKTYAGGALNATSPAPNCPQLDTSFIEIGAASEDW